METGWWYLWDLFLCQAEAPPTLLPSACQALQKADGASAWTPLSLHLPSTPCQGHKLSTNTPQWNPLNSILFTYLVSTNCIHAMKRGNSRFEVADSPGGGTDASNPSEAQSSKPPMVTGGILEGARQILHICKHLWFTELCHIANNWLGSPENRRWMLAGT